MGVRISANVVNFASQIFGQCQRFAGAVLDLAETSTAIESKHRPMLLVETGRAVAGILAIVQSGKDPQVTVMYSSTSVGSPVLLLTPPLEGETPLVGPPMPSLGQR